MIAGRLRVQERHFVDDAGWVGWRGVSDLAAIGYVLTGRADEVWTRFDAYVRGRRTVVRVLGMLGTDGWVRAGLGFSPRSPGYWAALGDVVMQAEARGMRVEFCFFADAQIVCPSEGERNVWLDLFADFCRAHPTVIPQLVNEPMFNGWDEADDPRLLRMADTLAARLGHRDFSIGDTRDGDNPDASAETTAKLVTVSKHCTIAVLHPDRSYGSDNRYRRWVDHLEGMTDVIRLLANQGAYVIDEPIGAARVGQPGRRDADPDAFVAAQAVAICCGFGFTYHFIASEIDVAQLPGFYEAADVLASMPVSPDWIYLNDSWPGAPTEGITWTGKTGKMRNLVRGGEAWTVAYGEGDWNSVRWRGGWTAARQYEGPRVCLWKARR